VSSSPTENAASSASRPGAAGTAGAVEIVMPQMGVSVAEGTIVEWRKRPGDWVEADETVCVVTTDKVDVEIPSPGSGRLGEIVVPEGETVDVGTTLASLDTGAKPGEAHPEEEERAEERDAEAPAATESEAAPATNGRDAETPDRSGFYSPVVRRIAAEHGIDLELVQGTGVGGRVRKRDLLAYIESEPTPARTAPAPEAKPGPVLHTESPYRPEEPVANGAAEPASRGVAQTTSEGEMTPGERREPLTPMRRSIAEHMLESRRTSAHCTTIVEADFSAVAEERRRLKDEMARRGAPLTYLAFVAQATVSALQRHPVLNASLDGEEIVYHDDVNLGIAVALDQGLIVPVIHQAQRLSLEGMAAAIADVASRAREGRLEPDDVHGGTFTITNPGQFGAVLATPIINQPQVAILDLEAIVKRPVVVEGEAGDAIAIHPMSYLCMSWDHRALDGAEAARFLADVRAGIEGWRAER
jgi:2-oxoglutarate dehydrogenase dihydrolipoamide succinyltransferase (E2 component)